MSAPAEARRLLLAAQASAVETSLLLEEADVLLRAGAVSARRRGTELPLAREAIQEVSVGVGQMACVLGALPRALARLEAME